MTRELRHRILSLHPASCQRKVTNAPNIRDFEDLDFELTVRDPGEGGDEVILADDGEPDEHVDRQQDVEEEAAPLPGGLVQQGGGELVHSWLDAGRGRPVGVRPHLHPGHGGIGHSGALIVGLALLLLVQS